MTHILYNFDNYIANFKHLYLFREMRYFKNLFNSKYKYPKTIIFILQSFNKQLVINGKLMLKILFCNLTMLPLAIEKHIWTHIS